MELLAWLLSALSSCLVRGGLAQALSWMGRGSRHRHGAAKCGNELDENTHWWWWFVVDWARRGF